MTGGRGLQLCKMLAAGPSIALAMDRKGISRQMGGVYGHELEYALYLQITCIMAEDFVEGLNAFLQKKIAFI